MMMWQCADAVVASIEQRKNRGYGLDHFKAYMESMGNPQDQLRSIHVAGTNGKGSTTNDIRSVLQEAGYRVGSFTSPYMISHYDRIRINDVDISEEDFLAIANEYDASWMTWDLSMFEIDMCIAVIYFLRQQVDYAVFEVGLGGRLDATNILHPMVSVITNIGLDHMELLGDTKEKIANEKAGIIKEGIPLITGEHSEECLAVFRQHVQQAHSIMMECDLPKHIQDREDGICFDYRGYQNIQLQTHATYQAYNASLCMEVIEYLKKQHQILVSEEQLRNGLRKANWIGRFEILRKHPLLLLDGAHNAHGIQALVDSLQGRKDIRVIFSVLKDKNFEEMLNLLETLTLDIVVTPFHNERALDVHQLDKRPHIRIVEDYRMAIKTAMEEGKDTVMTGSLYFISEVRSFLLQEEIV